MRKMRTDKCWANIGTWLMAESDADETKTYYIDVIMVDELVPMITFCSEFLYVAQWHLPRDVGVRRTSLPAQKIGQRNVNSSLGPLMASNR